MMFVTTDEEIVRGVSGLILAHLRRGPICSIDAWAYDMGIDHKYALEQFHALSSAGQIKLERQWAKPGRPYLVELIPGTSERK